MRISQEQKEILNSLICERLSSNQDNMYLVEDFFNSRNYSLEHTLKNEAMEEDDDGNVAYYVIKDKEQRILFFFSLKSGSLYDSHFNTHLFRLIKELNSFVQETLTESGLTPNEREELIRFQEKLRSHKGISKYDLDNLPVKKSDLFEDIEKELNKNITHVGKTYSGIELVHFCVNSKYESQWRNYGLPHSLGVIIFWKFIVPKVMEARNILGIQYLFLFAADISNEDTLINYYRDQLEFIHDEDKATAKPIYDLACTFMYQEIKDLNIRRNLFFENFNPDNIEV